MHFKGGFYKIIGKVLLVLYSVFLVLPMYMVVITALKPRTEIFTNPTGLPHQIALSNFPEAIKNGQILHNALNSIIVTGCSAVLIFIIDMMCAYGIYKIFNKRIGIFLYGFIVTGMMIPTVGYVSTILLYRSLHLYNTLAALVVSAVAGSLPFAIFILVGFLRGVPKEMEEAARIDGCNSIQSLLYVLAPIIKPAVVTVLIINIVSTWNSLLGPLILITKPSLFTIPVGMLNFKSMYSVQYNLVFAGALVVCVPMLIIYFAFQKYFVESLSGSVKS